MAVSFTKQKKKKQKFLLLIAVVIFMITIAVLWFGYFRDKRKVVIFDQAMPAPLISRNINIDLEIFENPLLKRQNKWRRRAVW